MGCNNGWGAAVEFGVTIGSWLAANGPGVIFGIRKGGWLAGDGSAIIIDDGMACWLGGDPLGQGGGGVWMEWGDACLLLLPGSMRAMSNPYSAQVTFNPCASLNSESRTLHIIQFWHPHAACIPLSPNLTANGSFTANDLGSWCPFIWWGGMGLCSSRGLGDLWGSNVGLRGCSVEGWRGGTWGRIIDSEMGTCTAPSSVPYGRGG